MEKVYVLVSDWSDDYEHGNGVSVYQNLDDAKKRLREEYKNFCEEKYDKDGTYNTRYIDVYGRRAECYEGGDFTRNHMEWTIYEETILKSC